MSGALRAAALYEEYKARHGGAVPYGDCVIIAALILTVVPEAVPVGGIAIGEDSGSHWWVEIGGEIVDPLGRDWLYPPTSYEERVRGRPHLLAALRSLPHVDDAPGLADGLSRLWSEGGR